MTDDLLCTPVFSKIMRRNIFQLILKFLHFSDNEDPNFDLQDENRDKLHKVRAFIEMLYERCLAVYYPGQYLSVDESLVLFKGRLKLKQYIRTERAKFEIKLYELCTSHGITLEFFVYCGKCMFYDEDGNEAMPMTKRISASLMISC